MSIYNRSEKLPFEAIRSKDLVFQAISWHAQDVFLEDENEDLYMIKIFGMDKDDHTVSVTVKGFTPFFYVRIPDCWQDRHVNGLTKHIMEALEEKYKGDSKYIHEVKMVHKKDFWGFTNDSEFKFARLCFRNQRVMKNVMYKILNKPINNNALGLFGYSFKQYESNIEPFLRFIHLANVSPTGWMSISRGNFRTTDILTTIAQIDVEANWQKVKPFKSDDTARFLIASFDLECMSDTGDFPVPIDKQYRKVASDLYEVYNDVLLKKMKDSVYRDAVLQALLKVFGIHDNDPIFALVYERMSPVYLKDPPKSLPALRRQIERLILDDALNILATPKAKREETVNKLNALLSKDSIGLPEVRGDEIIQIGTTYHYYGDRECCERVIITKGTCAPIENARVIECETEQEMLIEWRNLITNTNPDIITGYNIFGFDFWYLYSRAKDLGILSSFMTLSRFFDLSAKYEIKMLSSSALGDNELKFIDMYGCVLIDMMKVVQRDHKLDSYKLDAVASHFMKMKKHDVSPQDIFRLQLQGPEERKIIADYCLQDCALCNQLIMKLEIVANNMGMSNVCLVPLSYIFMRGQGIKIFSLVLKQCKDEDFLIPVVKPANRGSSNFGKKTEDPPPAEEEGYEGAIVLEPKRGIYINQPISVLDYASLYPSSMISENLSHDMIVLDAKYDNLPDMDYLDISYDIYEGVGDKKKKVDERIVRFAQPKDGSKGIIPRILQKLLMARKTTRKKAEWQQITLKDGTIYRGFSESDADSVKIKIADGPEAGTERIVSAGQVACIEDAFNDFQKAVLDGLQLAYKVTANSLYGQVGARTSPIYLKDIAACTTATGRKMIMMAKQYIEEKYEGAEIVYGDSVASYTPITCRHIKTGEIIIDTIENIASTFGQAWLPCTESGKQDKEGCVVTSLEVWSDKGWTPIKNIIRHPLAQHKSMIRVLTHQGLVDVTDDHSLLRPDGSEVSPTHLKVGDEILHYALFVQGQNTYVTDETEAFRMGEDAARNKTKVPVCILGASVGIRSVFAEGFWNACEYVTLSDQVVCASICALMHSLGENISIVNHNNTYTICLCLDNALNKIKKLSTLDSYKGFVYDITTENHHFQAGIGSIIVHNTDSLFVSFRAKDDMGNVLTGVEALRESRRLGIDASKHFKKLIKPPHDLEFEKIFDPFILLSKKRYIGNKYEMDDYKFKQSSMGVVLKRRDNAQIVKKVYGGAIDKILNDKDLQGSLEFVREELTKLVNGNAPLEDLIITKSLRAEYADPSRIAHKVLAERIGDRDPGNRPQVNDRIPFVYVQQPPPADPTLPKSKQPKILQGERIEHPAFIREHNLTPDYGFYITNQIMKPLLQLYGIVADQLGLRTQEEYEEVYRELLTNLTESKAIDKLDAIKEKDVQEFLFEPFLKLITPEKPPKATRKKKDAASSTSCTVNTDNAEGSTSNTIAKKKAGRPRKTKALDLLNNDENPLDRVPDALKPLTDDEYAAVKSDIPELSEEAILKALPRRRIVKKEVDPETDKPVRKRITSKKTHEESAKPTRRKIVKNGGEHRSKNGAP